MSKHTPGPWAWRSFGRNWCLVADHGARKVVLDAEPIGPTELSVIRTRDFEDGSVLKQITPDHPNAALIAAAPEMLEALNLALEQIEPTSKAKLIQTPQFALRMIREAIAKAEGRS